MLPIHVARDRKFFSDLFVQPDHRTFFPMDLWMKSIPGIPDQRVSAVHSDRLMDQGVFWKAVRSFHGPIHGHHPFLYYRYVILRDHLQDVFRRQVLFGVRLSLFR